MSSMIIRKPENRLAMLIRKPGGKSIAQAMADVDVQLDTIRDVCLAELKAKLAAIQAVGAVCRDASTADNVKTLYGLCNDVPEIAGAVGHPEVAAAALSLCELLDGQGSRDGWSRSAVDVHLDGLRLLADQGEAFTPEQRAAVVDGLRRVVERTLR